MRRAAPHPDRPSSPLAAAGARSLQALGIVSVLLLAGCTAPSAPGPATQNTPADYEPQEIWAGTLTAVALDGDRLDVTLDTTVRACEAVRGAAALNVTVPARLLSPPVTSLAEFRDRAERDPTPISAAALLAPGDRVLGRWNETAADGSHSITMDVIDVVAYHEANGTVQARLAEYPTEPTLWLGAPSSTMVRRFVDAREPFGVEDLEVGDQVTLHLTRTETLRLDDVTSGSPAEDCAAWHHNDLTLRPHQAPVGFPAGVAVPLDVRLENLQDVPLTLRTDPALLVDLSVLLPYEPVCPEGASSVQTPGPEGGEPGTAPCTKDRPEDRLPASVVAGCAVEAGDVTVPARATATWPLVVTCSDDKSSDDTASWAVLASGRFVDELGNEHRLPARQLSFVAEFVEVQAAMESQS